MACEYNLYCAFDLEKHKKTYVNYLEVLILEDGTIVYALPSHQEKAIALACARLHVTREKLQKLCPPDFYWDYISWLCATAKCVAVWNDHCIAVDPTVKQIGALRKLKMAGLYTGSIPKDVEYPDCLKRLSPEEKEVHLLGKWGPEEKKEA